MKLQFLGERKRSQVEGKKRKDNGLGMTLTARKKSEESGK